MKIKINKTSIYKIANNHWFYYELSLIKPMISMTVWNTTCAVAERLGRVNLPTILAEHLLGRYKTP